MSDKKKVLDAIFDALYDEPLTKEECEESLRSFGIDPDLLVKEGLHLVKALKRNILFEQKLRQLKSTLARRTKLLERAKSWVSQEALDDALCAEIDKELKGERRCQ